MSAGLSSSELIQGLLDSFEEPTPAPHDMASEPIPDSSQAKAEVPAAFQHLEDDATALKRMRLETQDMLQLIGTEKLNDSVVKALRLWMCSTHPYAVVQQWEHALDTLAIRGAATKEGADTLTRAKSAMTDWYHRVKFGVTGSSRAPDAKEELAKLQRGGKAGAGAAPMPKLDEDEASAFAGANGTSEAETQGGDTQPARKQRSLSITLDSPVHCAAEGEEGPSPLLLAARDLHTLDAVIRTTQWARIDRRLAGRDRGVPLAVGPDVRPDMYVLLMRPDSVGFAATHSSSSDRAATSSQDGQEGVGHSVAAAAAAAGKARSGSTAGGAKAGSRSSISLPIGPSVSTLRPERDHKGRPLTTEVLPELPGLARGTVGAWAQSTPPHMLPVVEDQLPPQPAVVPVPGALIPVPALQEASHPVTLTNIGRAKAKISFRVTQAHPPASASVHVEPPAIVVRRGESVTVQVIVHVVSPGVDVSAIILGEDERGARVPLCVRCLASPQVFAVPLRKLVMVQDCGLRVPAVLRALRQALEATGGYAAEGIFRLAPGDSMVKTVRAALDSGRYIPPSPLASAGVIPAEGVVNATSRDVAAAAEAATRAAMEGQGLVPAHALSSATCYTAAHVIKILYRNLPCRVLQNVPSTVLAGAKTQEAALRVVKEFVKPPHTDLLWWLVQLLTRVAEGAAWTKMTAKNCAIVAAPNLCAVEADENPMEALLLSQQTTMLLTHLIEFKLSQRSAIATPGGGEGEADGGALSRELAELAKGPTFLKALLPVAEQAQDAASSPSDAAAPPSRLPASSLGEMAVPPARSAGSTGSPDSDATGHRHHLHRASTSVTSYTNEELQQALAGIRTSTSADGGGEVSPPQERPPPLAPRPPSLPPPPHLNQAAIQVPAQQPESEGSSPELDGQQPAAPVPPMIPPPPPQQQAVSGGQAPPASHATGRMAPPSGAPPPPMASNTNLTQGDGPPPPPTQAEDMPPPPPPMPDSEATPSETQGDEPAPLAGSPPKPAQAGGSEVDEALETYETHAVPPPEQTAEALDASEVHFEQPSLEQVGEVGARSTAAAAPGDLQMPQAETGVETEAAVHPEEAGCGESAGRVETVADALDASAADAAAAAPVSASPHAPVFEADAEGDTLHDASSAEQAMDGNVAEVVGTDALRSDSESAAGAGEEGVNFFGDAADDSSEASADG